jgi:hypothetical protein
MIQRLRPRCCDAVRRVYINHLDLPGHSLLLKQRVHYQEGITSNQTVRPAVRVFVKVNRVMERQPFFGPLEQGWLYGESVAVSFADGLNDGARVNRLVNVKRDRRDLERGVLFLPGPNKLRIEVRVVG